MQYIFRRFTKKEKARFRRSIAEHARLERLEKQAAALRKGLKSGKVKPRIIGVSHAD